MLTHAYPLTYIIITQTNKDRTICLFNTNILYEYINPSLPSLYGRLDFFHNHDIVSRTRQGALGIAPLRTFDLVSHIDVGLHILPCIPRTQTFDICLASASLEQSLDLAFPLTSVLSTAQLDTCASPNWSPDTASLYKEPEPECTSHDNASRGVTQSMRGLSLRPRMIPAQPLPMRRTSSSAMSTPMSPRTT